MHKEDLLAALFMTPPCADPAALTYLPEGALWSSFLPGATPAASLAILGDGALETLTLAVGRLPDIDETLASIGFPCRWSGSPDALAAAIITDCRRLMAPSPGIGSHRILVRHPSRAVCLEMVGDCLDFAAREASDGRLADPLTFLYRSPRYDLRPMLGFADADTKLRFAKGFVMASGDIDLFRQGYFRRSAIAGMMLLASEALQIESWGHQGFDAEGWPAWWQCDGRSQDALLSCLPSSVSAFSVWEFGSPAP